MAVVVVVVVAAAAAAAVNEMKNRRPNKLCYKRLKVPSRLNVARITSTTVV